MCVDSATHSYLGQLSSWVVNTSTHCLGTRTLVWWVDVEHLGPCEDVTWLCPVPSLPGGLLLVRLSWSSDPPTPTLTPARSTQFSCPSAGAQGPSKASINLSSQPDICGLPPKRQVWAFKTRPQGGHTSLTVQYQPSPNVSCLEKHTRKQSTGSLCGISFGTRISHSKQGSCLHTIK